MINNILVAGATASALASGLNRLDGELSNNGGSSMKDSIDRIEKALGTK